MIYPVEAFEFTVGGKPVIITQSVEYGFDLLRKAMIEESKAYGMFPLGSYSPSEPPEFMPGFLPCAGDVKRELRNFRRRQRKESQLRFDRYIFRLRRAGYTRMANRAIILDLVKGWPRRNGRYT